MSEKQRELMDASFDMSISDEVATVKRTFKFQGASIAFDIGIGINGEGATITVSELHRRSVEEVIAMLQGLIQPQK